MNSGCVVSSIFTSASVMSSCVDASVVVSLMSLVAIFLMLMWSFGNGNSALKLSMAAFRASIVVVVTL